jgi:hypothetical protein
VYDRERRREREREREGERERMARVSRLKINLKPLMGF